MHRRRKLVRWRADPPGLGELRPELVVRGAGLGAGLQRQQCGPRLGAGTSAIRPRFDQHDAGSRRRHAGEPDSDWRLRQRRHHRFLPDPRLDDALGPGQRRGRQQRRNGILRDARSESVHRAGLPPHAERSGNQHPGDHPFDDRLGQVFRVRGPRLLSPSSSHARCGTGSSPS